MCPSAFWPKWPNIGTCRATGIRNEHIKLIFIVSRLHIMGNCASSVALEDKPGAQAQTPALSKVAPANGIGEKALVVGNSDVGTEKDQQARDFLGPPRPKSSPSTSASTALTRLSGAAMPPDGRNLVLIVW